MRQTDAEIFKMANAESRASVMVAMINFHRERFGNASGAIAFLVPSLPYASKDRFVPFIMM